MEIKVGQYLRHENNIYKFQGYCDCSYCKSRGFKEPILNGVEPEYITTKEWWIEYLEGCKINDMPQDLIQCGDLVQMVNETTLEQVRRVLPKKIYTTSSYCNREFITKIYTPNEDKSQYTLQWEQTK